MSKGGCDISNLGVTAGSSETTLIGGGGNAVYGLALSGNDVDMSCGNGICVNTFTVCGGGVVSGYVGRVGVACSNNGTGVNNVTTVDSAGRSRVLGYCGCNDVASGSTTCKSSTCINNVINSTAGDAMGGYRGRDGVGGCTSLRSCLCANKVMKCNSGVGVRLYDGDGGMAAGLTMSGDDTPSSQLRSTKVINCTAATSVSRYCGAKSILSSNAKGNNGCTCTKNVLTFDRSNSVISGYCGSNGVRSLNMSSSCRSP